MRRRHRAARGRSVRLPPHRIECELSLRQARTLLRGSRADPSPNANRITVRVCAPHIRAHVAA